MFSQLGPLFKTTFRRTESNDTRQAIPHNERDKGRAKDGEENQKKESADPWEDNTTVSIEALRGFLVNFLKTMMSEEANIEDEQAPNKDIRGNDKTDKQINQPISTRPPESKRPTSTKNARAVRAYQSIAEKTQSTVPPAPKPDKQGELKGTSPLLESEEFREIHSLIDDLDMLARKGVQTLHIPRGDDFLESLKNAVLLEKSKI